MQQPLEGLIWPTNAAKRSLSLTTSCRNILKKTRGQQWTTAKKWTQRSHRTLPLQPLLSASPRIIVFPLAGGLPTKSNYCSKSDFPKGYVSRISGSDLGHAFSDFDAIWHSTHSTHIKTSNEQCRQKLILAVLLTKGVQWCSRFSVFKCSATAVMKSAWITLVRLQSVYEVATHHILYSVMGSATLLWNSRVHLSVFSRCRWLGHSWSSGL